MPTTRSRKPTAGVSERSSKLVNTRHRRRVTTTDATNDKENVTNTVRNSKDKILIDDDEFVLSSNNGECKGERIGSDSTKQAEIVYAMLDNVLRSQLSDDDNFDTTVWRTVVHTSLSASVCCLSIDNVKGLVIIQDNIAIIVRQCRTLITQAKSSLSQASATSIDDESDCFVMVCAALHGIRATIARFRQNKQQTFQYASTCARLLYHILHVVNKLSCNESKDKATIPTEATTATAILAYSTLSGLLSICYLKTEKESMCVSFQSTTQFDFKAIEHYFATPSIVKLPKRSSHIEMDIPIHEVVSIGLQSTFLVAEIILNTCLYKPLLSSKSIAAFTKKYIGDLVSCKDMCVLDVSDATTFLENIGTTWIIVDSDSKRIQSHSRQAWKMVWDATDKCRNLSADAELDLRRRALCLLYAAGKGSDTDNDLYKSLRVAYSSTKYCEIVCSYAIRAINTFKKRTKAVMEIETNCNAIVSLTYNTVGALIERFCPTKRLMAYTEFCFYREYDVGYTGTRSVSTCSTKKCYFAPLSCIFVHNECYCDGSDASSALVLLGIDIRRQIASNKYKPTTDSYKLNAEQIIYRLANQIESKLIDSPERVFQLLQKLDISNTIRDYCQRQQSNETCCESAKEAELTIYGLLFEMTILNIHPLARMISERKALSRDQKPYMHEVAIDYMLQAVLLLEKLTTVEYSLERQKRYAGMANKTMVSVAKWLTADVLAIEEDCECSSRLLDRAIKSYNKIGDSKANNTREQAVVAQICSAYMLLARYNKSLQNRGTIRMTMCKQWYNIAKKLLDCGMYKESIISAQFSYKFCNCCDEDDQAPVECGNTVESLLQKVGQLNGIFSHYNSAVKIESASTSYCLAEIAIRAYDLHLRTQDCINTPASEANKSQCYIEDMLLECRDLFVCNDTGKINLHKRSGRRSRENVSEMHILLQSIAVQNLCVKNKSERSGSASIGKATTAVYTQMNWCFLVIDAFGKLINDAKDTRVECAVLQSKIVGQLHSEYNNLVQSCISMLHELKQSDEYILQVTLLLSASVSLLPDRTTLYGSVITRQDKETSHCSDAVCSAASEYACGTFNMAKTVYNSALGESLEALVLLKLSVYHLCVLHTNTAYRTYIDIREGEILQYMCLDRSKTSIAYDEISSDEAKMYWIRILSTTELHICLWNKSCGPDIYIPSYQMYEVALNQDDYDYTTMFAVGIGSAIRILDGAIDEAVGFDTVHNSRKGEANFQSEIRCFYDICRSCHKLLGSSCSGSTLAPNYYSTGEIIGAKTFASTVGYSKTFVEWDLPDDLAKVIQSKSTSPLVLLAKSIVYYALSEAMRRQSQLGKCVELLSASYKFARRIVGSACADKRTHRGTVVNSDNTQNSISEPFVSEASAVYSHIHQQRCIRAIIDLYIKMGDTKRAAKYCQEYLSMMIYDKTRLKEVQTTTKSNARKVFSHCLLLRQDNSPQYDSDFYVTQEAVQYVHEVRSRELSLSYIKANMRGHQKFLTTALFTQMDETNDMLSIVFKVRNIVHGLRVGQECLLHTPYIYKGVLDTTATTNSATNYATTTLSARSSLSMHSSTLFELVETRLHMIKSEFCKALKTLSKCKVETLMDECTAVYMSQSKPTKLRAYAAYLIGYMYFNFITRETLMRLWTNDDESNFEDHIDVGVDGDSDTSIDGNAHGYANVRNNIDAALSHFRSGLMLSGTGSDEYSRAALQYMSMLSGPSSAETVYNINASVNTSFDWYQSSIVKDETHCVCNIDNSICKATVHRCKEREGKDVVRDKMGSECDNLCSKVAALLPKDWQIITLAIAPTGDLLASSITAKYDRVDNSEGNIGNLDYSFHCDPNCDMKRKDAEHSEVCTKACQSQCVFVERNESNGGGLYDDIMLRLDNIVEESQAQLRYDDTVITNNDTCSDSETDDNTKKTWWSKRKQLNTDMEQLLLYTDEYYMTRLDFWPQKLHNSTDDVDTIDAEDTDNEDNMSFITNLALRFDATCNVTENSKNENDNVDTNGSYEGNSNGNGSDSVSSSSSNDLTVSNNKKNCLFLILDENLSRFPFESLPSLQDLTVCRLPSLKYAHEKLESMSKAGQMQHYVDPLSVRFVLDPERNLSATVDRILPQLTEISSRYNAEWQGHVNTIPDATFIEDSISGRDDSLYMYIGHGGGTNYYSKRHCEKLCKRTSRNSNSEHGLEKSNSSTVILMGCSSGRLESVNQQDWKPSEGEIPLLYEPEGIALAYLSAGVSCVIGNLWDVTDRDIDRFSCTMLDLFFDNSNRTTTLNSNDKNGSKDSDKNKSYNAHDIGMDDERTSEPKSLAKCMAESRSACRMQYIVGSAPVCYGFPVYLR